MPRVIRIETVPNRPELSAPEPDGVEGWRLMTQLVVAALAAAGEEARVDRSVVRVFRNGERPNDG